MKLSVSYKGTTGYVTHQVHISSFKELLSALSIFMKRIVREQRIPFEIRTGPQEEKNTENKTPLTFMIQVTPEVY